MKRLSLATMLEIVCVLLIVVLTAQAAWTIHKIGNWVPQVVVIEAEP